MKLTAAQTKIFNAIKLVSENNFRHEWDMACYMKSEGNGVVSLQHGRNGIGVGDVYFVMVQPSSLNALKEAGYIRFVDGQYNNRYYVQLV